MKRNNLAKVLGLAALLSGAAAVVRRVIRYVRKRRAASKNADETDEDELLLDPSVLGSLSTAAGSGEGRIFW